MVEVETRALAADECDSVGVLLRNSYERRLHRFLVYCQVGIATYLRDGIEYDFLAAGRTRSVAVTAGVVVGYAEWLKVGASHHLSHLCVSRKFRGAGVGRALMRDYLAGLDLAEAEVTLDVFAHNEPAVRLYRRLGLRSAGRDSTWMRAPIMGGGDGLVPSMEVDNALSTVASLTRYGFATLNGEVAAGRFRVGLIGTTVKVENPREITDTALHGALQAAIPSLTDILYVAPPGESTPSTPEVLLRSVRMEGPAAEVRRILG